jgi:hypothetical protein
MTKYDEKHMSYKKLVAAAMVNDERLLDKAHAEEEMKRIKWELVHRLAEELIDHVVYTEDKLIGTFGTRLIAEITITIPRR